MELFEEKGYSKGLARSKVAEEALNKLGFEICLLDRKRTIQVMCTEKTEAVINYNKINNGGLRASKNNGSIVASCVYKDPAFYSTEEDRRVVRDNNKPRHVIIHLEDFRIFGDRAKNYKFGPNDTLIKLVYNYFKIFCAGIKATVDSYRDEQFTDKPVDEVMKMIFGNKYRKDKAPNAPSNSEAMIRYRIKENRVKSDKANKDRDINYYKRLFKKEL
jgi:hypothetical protein